MNTDKGRNKSLAANRYRTAPFEDDEMAQRRSHFHPVNDKLLSIARQKNAGTSGMFRRAKRNFSVLL
jgi:hypothetical protein